MTKICPTDSAFVRALFDEEEISDSKINWGAISGLALSAIISAGFWTGLAVLIQRVWK